MRRSLILHPMALVTLVALVVNDHWLKTRYPGWVTGKLSDFAGLLLLPILIVATIELATRTLLSIRAVWIIASTVTVGFVLVESTALGAQMYEQGMGILQLPFRSLISGADAAVPVHHVADLADLIALPVAFVVCLIGRDRSKDAHPAPGRSTTKKSSS